VKDDHEILLAFQRALEARDIIPPRHLLGDGKLHRCDAAGRNGKGDAAYILFLDNIPAGGFENHRDGRGWENWRADVDRVLSAAEQELQKKRNEAARAARAADERLRRAEAATRADTIWADAQEDCIGHAYLTRKAVEPFGIRTSRGNLLVPVRDLNGTLHSLQFIRPDGSKKFLRDGRVGGCCHLIGDIDAVAILAEGYVTAASLYLATGHGVAVAFNAGNLPPVAEAVRAKYPDARIIVAGDDDHLTNGNPGITKAREAAAKVAGAVAAPDFSSIERPADATDFNDMARLLGLDAVRDRILGALMSPPAAAPVDKKAPPEKLSQRDKLITVTDSARVWRCTDGIAHARIPVGQHVEHHRLRSPRFREWLILEAGRRFPTVIAGISRPSAFGKNAIEDALSFTEALAAASENRFTAALRVTAHEDRFYLDLGDPEWRAADISPGGWRIVDAPPVPLLRTRRTRALPMPQHGGSLEPLRQLLPIAGDDEFRLIVLWMLAALRPFGPYPIIAWSGEQGTGKSFASKVLRRLVDPSGDDIMQPPREDRDLIAAARSNHVLAFDNLSSVSSELADSFCRLSTGGDLGGRRLYTDDESAAFGALRPLILNGIPDLTTRGDLASRTVFVRLSPMRKRRPEAELWAQFDDAAPGILGALLTALAAAMARLPGVRLPEDSADLRMADFAVLAIAAEPALGWPEGTAIAAVRRNAQTAATALVDLDAVAVVLRRFIEQEGAYTGLVSGLYMKLSESVDADTRRSPGWPKGPARFGEHLRRLSPALRAAGIDVVERRVAAGMGIEIVLRASDVGNPLSLLIKFEKEEEGEERAKEGNKGRVPTSPTCPESEDGGNAGPLPDIGHVGDVGNVGATYIKNGEAPPGVSANHVGDVGENPLKFTRAAAGRIKL
jgi:phage/plasmid primase-like uncharacterized protein